MSEKAEPGRAVVDGSSKEGRQHVGPRPRRVLGHIRYRQTCLHGDVDRLGAPLGNEVHVPLLDILPYGARPDERVDVDRDADALADLDHRRDVADDGAPGRRELDLHLALDDFAGEAEAILEGALPGPREADVDLFDPDIVHQVNDVELVLDGRVLDARVLQPRPRSVSSKSANFCGTSRPFRSTSFQSNVSSPRGSAVVNEGIPFTISAAALRSRASFPPSRAPHRRCSSSARSKG